MEYQLRRFTDVMSTGDPDRMFVGDAGEKTDKLWDDIIDGMYQNIHPLICSN